MDRALTITDCHEFRSVIRQRPHLVTHIILLICIVLVVGALFFLSVTKANLVVRCDGRIRSSTDPVQIYSGEAFNQITGARVQEVAVHKGSVVNKGEVLMRFDTGSIDNEISKLKRILETEVQELARLNKLRHLLSKEFDSAAAKANAELKQGSANFNLAKEHRKSGIHLARLSLESASDELSRLDQMFRKNRNAISKQEHFKARIRVQQASAELNRAKLPVDDSQLHVLKLAAAMIGPQREAELAALDIKRDAKRGTIATATSDLKNLELTRTQSIVRSTIRGVIISDVPQVGDVIQAATPVVQIAAHDSFHFHVAIPNEQAGDLKIGMRVRIKLDTFDYRQYGVIPGKIIFIAPDSKKRDRRNDINTSYLVKIHFNQSFVGDAKTSAKLKLGLSGQAEIVTDSKLLLTLLVNRIEKTISL